MKIEVLFPEFCNLFGDAYNMVYLEKTLPEAEFIRTKFSDDVRFTEEKMNLVYMGPMTERMQEQVIRKLMPLKEKIQKAIDDGTVFLFTGNALEIFGDYIENEDGSRVECLGLYRLYAKRDMMHRHNSDFEGEFDGNVIMGFKTQFTMAYTPDESHGLFVKNKGVGLNIKAKYEGIRVNNFFGTYLVGPILVLNPPFTKYILNLMGAGDVKLAFEAENMEPTSSARRILPRRYTDGAARNSAGVRRKRPRARFGLVSVCAVEKSGVFLRAPAKPLLARLERGFR